MSATISSTDEKVQVRFTVRDVDGTEFTDALYFTQAERAAVTPDQLAAMQMDRFNKWKAAIAPPVDVKPVSQAESAASLKATVLSLIDSLRADAEAL